MFGIRKFISSLRPPSIDPSSLDALIQAGEPVTILDITDSEWDIDNKENVSIHHAEVDEFKTGIPEEHENVISGERHVVTVCSNGQQSQVAATALQNLDVDASWLKEGKSDWDEYQSSK